MKTIYQLKFLLWFLFFFGIIDSGFAALRSRTTQGQAWTGDIRLESDVIRVTVNPAYLDIEEELVLSPYNITNTAPTGDQETLEIFGNFTLPENSIIVGMLLWNGDEILKAKLKGNEDARNQYEEVVDRNTSPPPQPRDPVIVEKISDTGYSLAIYPVKWGSSRRVRIRYLIPARLNSGKLRMPLPFVFGREVKEKPNWFELSLKGANGVSQVFLEKGFIQSPQTLPITLLKKLETDIEVGIPGASMPLLSETAFDQGDWAGNYRLFWSEVPDSLLVKAGLKTEVVFLWKWNLPNSFVQWYGGKKSVSFYGKELIS